MSETVFTSVSEFVDQLDAIASASCRTFYRGQSVQGNLVPSIGRFDKKFNSTEHERKALEEFSRIGSMRIPNGMSQLSRLVLAQHHGLKTRLLDWTMNPLAALWFAVRGWRSKAEFKNYSFIEAFTNKVYVYALHENDFEPIQASDRMDPFERVGGKPALLFPSEDNSRIAAQNGCFTIHFPGENGYEPIPIVGQDDGVVLEFGFQIKNCFKIERELIRLMITNRLLFPDLDGIAKDVNLNLLDFDNPLWWEGGACGQHNF